MSSNDSVDSLAQLEKMKTASMAKSPEKGRGNVCDTIRGSVIGAVEDVFMVLGVVDGVNSVRSSGAFNRCVYTGR
ncbi:MAG: hypothetical protein RI513_03345 [Balneolaceae bacterium]|nr:hypothetical protein [Balneolaceae bacterium]